MAFSMAGGGPSGPQINVTPLIDVLLTLIVVFMIVVAMEQDKGERVQIPQPQTQQTPEQRQSRTIVIQLVWSAKGQSPELKINGEQIGHVLEVNVVVSPRTTATFSARFRKISASRTSKSSLLTRGRCD